MAGETLQGKLRICMLVPQLGTGGAEVQVLQLLKFLDRSCFAVSLCTLKRGDREMEEAAERHTDTHRILGFRWRTLPVAFIRLVRYLAWGDFDVLHCHLPLADVIGRPAGRLARIPVIVTTEHGKHLWKSRPHLLLERMLSGITDLRICVSRDIIDIRRRREGTPQEKLVYIPNAVDIESVRRVQKGRAAVMASFGWGVGDPLVLSVGRLVPAKDYPLLVEAIGIVRGYVPQVRCLIAGEGACRSEIERTIAAHGLRGVVELAGTRRDIPDLLAAADVFVLTSVREGLPVSLLEAMAAGKGIVCTSAGGIPDAIADGESGLLAPPGEAPAIAEAVRRLLTDMELRSRLGEAALATVERSFGVASVAARIGERYRELVARKRGARRPCGAPCAS